MEGGDIFVDKGIMGVRAVAKESEARDGRSRRGSDRLRESMRERVQQQV